MAAAKQVSLLDHQIKHTQKIVELFENNEKLYIDTSVMGSGKTYVALRLAQMYNLRLFVICPKGLINTWTLAAKEYGVPVECIETFAHFRSSKCPWISQTKKTVLMSNNKSVEQIEYKHTHQFEKSVEKGVLFVIDEFHNLKNVTAQTLACAALTRYIFHGNHSATATKMAFLSATPFDKCENVVNIFRITGVMKQNELFEPNYFGRGFEMRGLKDIIDKCRCINVEIADKAAFAHDKKSSFLATYILYTRVFQKRFVHAMPIPELKATLDCKNVFCNLPNIEAEEKLTAAITNLAESCKYSSKDSAAGVGVVDKTDFGAIGGALMRLESLKVAYIVKQKVKEELERTQNGKVVVFVNFYDPAFELINTFQKYNPLFLNGSMNIQDRARVVKLFQEPNTKHRLFIANMQVGGVGIDLDDRDGRFPRTMFVLPTFHILNMHQATGRICRSSTKSNGIVRMVYTKMGELQIINALARKTSVLNTIAQSSDKVKFPGDYAVITED